MSQLTELFTAIANAIRAKTGDSSTIAAANFPEKIATISGNDVMIGESFHDAVFNSLTIKEAINKELIAFCSPAWSASNMSQAYIAGIRRPNQNFWHLVYYNKSFELTEADSYNWVRWDKATGTLSATEGWFGHYSQQVKFMYIYI